MSVTRGDVGEGRGSCIEHLVYPGTLGFSCRWWRAIEGLKDWAWGEECAVLSFLLSFTKKVWRHFRKYSGGCHLGDEFGDHMCPHFWSCTHLGKEVFTTYSQWMYAYSQMITIQLCICLLHALRCTQKVNAENKCESRD